jgi:hypothetical protein
LIYNSQTDTQEYWNGEKWVSLVGASPWFVSRSTNSATSDLDTLYHTAPVVIGDKAAVDPTAALNVVSDNKGVLLPRVTLKSPTDKVTIANPTTGLLVYNTGTESTFTIKGYMYWDGVSWQMFDSSEAVPASVEDLTCGGAQLSPASYYAGQPYEGVMKLPYVGGNGGKYTAGQPYTSNGLTFVLQSGKLEVGNGDLAFRVTGTPDISSPTPITVPIDNTLIPFYQGTCSAVVGDVESADIRETAVMGPLRWAEAAPDNARNGYQVKVTTPDGKYSVRAFVWGPTNAEGGKNSTTGGAGGFNVINLQIKNNMTVADTIITNEAWLWGGSGGNQQNALILQPGVWSGYTADDATAGVNALVQDATNFVAWGDPEVYALSMPEHRIYAWMSNNNTNKVAYTLDFMAGARNPVALPNATGCPNGVCGGVKVYFIIKQVTAT